MKIYLALIGIALLFSGFAGLNNQVAWQRSLKTVLGGGESLSMTIAVLVFMLGLGLGSYWCSKIANKLKNPLKTFVLIEFLLCCVNGVICWLFTLDLSTTVFTVFSFAQNLGLSIQMVYTLFATLMLLFPCILMGITIPLTAEVCQRNLKLSSSAIISALIAINTLGSVIGVLSSGTILLPRLGLSMSLVFAIGASGVAVVALALVGFLSKWKTYSLNAEEKNESAIKEQKNNPEPNKIKSLLILSFLLGLSSLAYEMFLFRYCILQNTPLPQIFSGVVGGFLIFWSLGAFASSFKLNISLKNCNILLLLSLTSVAVLTYANLAEYIMMTLFITLIYLLLNFKKLPILIRATIAVYAGLYITDLISTNLYTEFPDEKLSSMLYYIGRKSILFIPCFFFGYLFGKIVSTQSSSWGKLVGRFYVFNTLGSTVGIALSYFVFSYVPLDFFLGSILALLIVATLLLVKITNQTLAKDNSTEDKTRQAHTFLRKTLIQKIQLIAPYAIVIFSIVVIFHKDAQPKDYVRYNGKQGMIRLKSDGNMNWDGLWHSALSKNDSHLGTKNWYLAIIPTLCHNSTAKDLDACVIGVGTGITAATFAKMDKFGQVDAYDINPMLELLHKENKEGTLHYSDNKKINTLWMDARAGLTLSDKKYDVIKTQPMYLRQAGASLLNSVEFFELVKRRLKKNGIFCLYSNGSPEQAFVIRETADRVFKYRETFFNGYMVLLSNDPIDYSTKSLQARIDTYPKLAAELAKFPDTSSIKKLSTHIDIPRCKGHDRTLFVSDDYPIIEYKYNLNRLIKAKKLPFKLPQSR